MVGNNVEVDSIQSVGSPVDGQNGSLRGHSCYKRHANCKDLAMVDRNDCYGIDYHL